MSYSSEGEQSAGTLSSKRILTATDLSDQSQKEKNEQQGSLSSYKSSTRDGKSYRRQTSRDSRSRSSHRSKKSQPSIDPGDGKPDKIAGSQRSNETENTFSSIRSLRGTEKSSENILASSSTLPSMKLNSMKHGSLKLDMDDTGLSSEAMRKKLFASFKSRGILEDVKSQLRTNLASVINEGHQISLSKEQKKQERSIFSHISDSLVAEHLLKAKYEYTLSVFKTESILPDIKMNSIEILQLMNINPGTKTYHNLSKMLVQRDSKSFLWNFISRAGLVYESPTVSVQCQTEGSDDFISDELETKLSNIKDTVYGKVKGELATKSLALEDRLIQLNQILEKKKKEEIEKEMKQFKEKFENEIKLQEKERYKHDLDKFKLEIERSYKEMFDNVKEREKEANEVIERKQKSLEAEAYEKRQNILKELQILRDREVEMKNIHDMAMKAVELQEAKAKAFAEELKVKELSLKTVQDSYDYKLKEGMMKLKLEQQQEEQRREEVLRLQESQLRDEKSSFEAEKSTVDRFRREFEQLKIEKSRLQESFNAALQKVTALNERSDDMKERLRKQADYAQVKEEALVSAKTNEYLESQVKELKNEQKARDMQHKKELKELMNRILNGTPESENLQKQLSSEREKFLDKENELQERCQRSEKRLHAEVVKNHELNQLYEECILHQKGLLRELEELRGLKRKSNTIDATKKFTQSSASKDIPRTVSTPSNIPVVSYQNFSQFSTDKRFERDVKFRDVNQDNSFSSEMLGTIFLKENRDVFEKLEREASELEQTYRDYQRRQERVSYTKPKTDEFMPLEKDYSTYVRDSVEREAAKQSGEIQYESIGESVPNRSIGQIQRQSKTVLEDTRERPVSILKGTKDSEENIQPADTLKEQKTFLDTWNGDHLTEQLLDSAVNHKDGEMSNIGVAKRAGETTTGLAFGETASGIQRGYSASHLQRSTAMFGSTNGQLHSPVHTSTGVPPALTDDGLVNEGARNGGGSSQKSISCEETKQRRIERGTRLPLSSCDSMISEPERKLSVEKYSQRVEDEQEIQNSLVHNAERYENIAGTVERPSFDAVASQEHREFGNDRKISQGISESSSRELSVDRQETSRERIERENKERGLAFERERIELERLEQEEREGLEKFEGDGLTGEWKEGPLEEIANEEENKRLDQEEAEMQNDNASNADSDDVGDADNIDPLMKHYMEMLLKKKAQEMKSEGENLNLTDDVKMESKMSKSDVSDLVEDEIEEIEQDSEDEFDW